MSHTFNVGDKVRVKDEVLTFASPAVPYESTTQTIVRGAVAEVIEGVDHEGDVLLRLDSDPHFEVYVNVKHLEPIAEDVADAIANAIAVGDRVRATHTDGTTVEGFVTLAHSGGWVWAYVGPFRLDGPDGWSFEVLEKALVRHPAGTPVKFHTTESGSARQYYGVVSEDGTSLKGVAVDTIGFFYGLYTPANVYDVRMLWRSTTQLKGVLP
jgi:hypothetical protein